MKIFLLFEIFEINFFLLGEISAVEKKRRKRSDKQMMKKVGTEMKIDEKLENR
jgi:hypothetical protein